MTLKATQEIISIKQDIDQILPVAIRNYNLVHTDLSVCVCSVREAVCVLGERGVLRPGQTLVEHDDDGLCHSRQCSRSLDPASGFHLLRTSSINCSAHCQPVRPQHAHQYTQTGRTKSTFFLYLFLILNSFLLFFFSSFFLFL